MTRTIYALLVGINDYLGNVPTLHGCVNDVKRVQEFLQLRTRNGEFALQELLLTSGDPDNPQERKPTRQAVIDGFRKHLTQAGPNDIALFYYSGHGSQAKAPEALWHLEPDHLNETIVCQDSRAGAWDLADKELAVFIAEVAKQNPHIVVILDSCHSGSGTRAINAPGIRLAPPDLRERPLESFEGLAQIKALQAAGANGQPGADWVSLPAGKHILISACRAEQVAAERQLGDQVHGVLSYFLLDTLSRTGAGLTYRDVFARTKALVRNRVADQDPTIEATDPDLLQEPFLGGAILPQPSYFALTHDQQKGWVIDGGAVHGIPAPSGGETTTLAVFPLGADLGAVKTLQDALGTARVTATEPGQSRVAFALASGAAPDPAQAFRALIVSQPLVPVTVTLSGDPAGLELVRQALASAGAGGTPSLIVRELSAADIAAAQQRSQGSIAPDSIAPLSLAARDGRFLIRRSADAYPLLVPVEGGYTPANAALAVQRLEHVARWLQIAELDNKTSRLPPNAVSMEFYAVRDDDTLGERLDPTSGLQLEYRRVGDTWEGPRFKLKLVNNTSRRLYCVLLDLTETFAVDASDLLSGAGEWLNPQGQLASELWANQDRPLYATIPDELQAMGVITLRDVLKLIVSTSEINATLLEQERLEVATRGGLRKTGASVPDSALNRLINRIQTRNIGGGPKRDEIISDWVTSQVTFTTVKPRDQVPVPQPGEPPAPLSDGVSIAPHAALKASLRLTSMPDAGRAVGNLLLPPALRSTSRNVQPFEFSSTRGGNPGLSVLELTLDDETTRSSVSMAAPLTLNVQQPLAAHELIMATAFDPVSGLFLPVGVGAPADGGNVTVQIYELPPPTADSRSVTGSIKLAFLKIASDWLRLGNDVNRLALVDFAADGAPSLQTDPVVIAQRIQAAQRVLLYVHGFTGDTETMVTSAPRLLQASPQTTVVLAFDYENLNTTIEDTALELRKKLIQVGLAPGHAAQLHIIAHSLGTMVTRWLIEQVPDGKEIVQHAILVGGPNTGTPWARIDDLANFLLGAALNGLLALAGPVGVVPKLLGMLASVVLAKNKLIKTLDEIKPGAAFYQRLNNPSIDPHRPYTLIAGDVKQIDYPATQVKSLQDLLARINSPETRQELVTFIFGGTPNDLVISVDSIRGVPPQRTPAPVALPAIACDHISYFVNELGLQALVTALARVA